jgi:hypothetical protein
LSNYIILKNEDVVYSTVTLVTLHRELVRSSRNPRGGYFMPNNDPREIKNARTNARVKDRVRDATSASSTAYRHSSARRKSTSSPGHGSTEK